MRLIVGLGNPGHAYQGTRHNVGFQIVDSLAERFAVTFVSSPWQAQLAEFDSWGRPLALVKPTTYMNASGQAVAALAAHYRISPAEIIVIHDDLDLPLPRLKVAVNRGAGGHNGIASVIDHLGSRDFVRVRIGIGRPEPTVAISDFVLAPFLPAEQAIVDRQMEAIRAVVRLIVDKGVVAAMSVANR